MSSVRLPAEMEEQVRRVARARGVTVSEVHRLALKEYCERELAAGRASRYDDVIGVARATGDRRDVAEKARELFGQIIDERHGRHPG